MPTKPAVAGTKPMPAPHYNLINGKACEAADGRTIDVVCPSDGVIFATIARSGTTDAARAVLVARDAFDNGPWPRMSPTERGQILTRVADLIRREHEDLAALDARDVGKLVASCRSDVTVLARYFEFYAAAADKFGGEVIPMPEDTTAFTCREPLGVVVGILPWNSPTQMFGRVVAPALAMGNTVVLKPAEDACLSTLRLGELALEAGVPPGALNVVTGYGSEVGAALSAHPGIDFISFTGSPEAGMLVQQAAARNHVGVTLELGGKSPQIIFPDADLKAALPVIVNSIIVNSGQTCVAGSRLLVHSAILDRVQDLFAERFQQLCAGGHDMNCDLGPLINPKQQARVQGMIDAAIAEGVPVLAQGSLAPGAPRDGYYIRPTLLGPVPRDNAIALDEVFGPVLSLLPFSNEADAIQLANATRYGLAAGIWANDIGIALRTARRIRSGQVYINGYGAGGGVELPFGGFKKSGHGREKGLEALRAFSATKAIVIKH
jgi:aldehyde dehydrogenase (NAD+)